MALWFGIGSLGLLAGAIRTASHLVMAPEGTPWTSEENWEQRLLLSVGWIGLVLFGLFPQWTQPLLVNLPQMFEHIGH